MSRARDEWCTVRARRIDELESAHAMVRQPGRGRQWRTGEINAALIVRVAVEFQGYARDLHDECADYLAGHVAASHPALAGVVRASLTLNRALDVKNAQPGSLGSDFGRLGVDFWPALSRSFPASAGLWNKELSLLNEARNGIAHHDEPKLRSVAAKGRPTRQFATARAFRRSANSLVDAMDSVMRTELPSLTGGPAPW